MGSPGGRELPVVHPQSGGVIFDAHAVFIGREDGKDDRWTTRTSSWRGFSLQF